MKLANLKDMNREDLLGALGLSTRPTATGQLVETLATFGIGLLVGAGVALLLAPKPGRELRQEIRTRISPEREQTLQT
jgi:hypothetical protein